MAPETKQGQDEKERITKIRFSDLAEMPPNFFIEYPAARIALSQLDKLL